MLFLIGSNLGEFLPHSNHTQTYHAIIIKDMGEWKCRRGLRNASDSVAAYNTKSSTHAWPIVNQTWELKCPRISIQEKLHN